MSLTKTVVEKDDVEKVFNELLEDNGIATSVEVKNKLRNAGFWATQERVTGFMREIAIEDGIDFDFNGTYREYLLNSKPSYNTQANLASKPAGKPPIDPEDRDPVSHPMSGDWEAFDANAPNTKYYFKGKLSAGQAKSAFCNHLSTDFLSARVKRY